MKRVRQFGMSIVRIGMLGAFLASVLMPAAGQQASQVTSAPRSAEPIN
jgi:hypothetical protein